MPSAETVCGTPILTLTGKRRSAVCDHFSWIARHTHVPYTLLQTPRRGKPDHRDFSRRAPTAQLMPAMSKKVKDDYPAPSRSKASLPAARTPAASPRP